MIFSKFVYMVDFIDRFLYVEPSMLLLDENYFVMVYDFSVVLPISVFQYFIEYFCINVYE